MATTKKAETKVDPKAKVDDKKKKEKEVAPRDMTAAQRRENFLKAKEDISDDWRILKANVDEDLTPFGYIVLDYVLGLKGIPDRGRVTHIHGNEGAGKSTLVYGVAAHYQRTTGEPVVIFDYENTAVSKHLRGIGLDENMAVVKHPTSIQDGIKTTLDFMKQGVRFFAYDSIPRMNFKIEEKDIMSGQAFKPTMGKHARAIKEFYDIILPYAGEYNCEMFMINQTRDRIESTNEAALAQKYPSFTNLPYILPGGRANRFNAAIMLELQTKKAYRAGGFKDDPFILEPGENKGNFVATCAGIRALKNKVSGGGFRGSEVWHRPGTGMDENIMIRSLARTLKLIDYSGKRYYIGENIDEAAKVFDSKDEAIQRLVIDQDAELLDALKNLIIKSVSRDASAFETTVSDDMAKYLSGEKDESGAEDIDFVLDDVEL
jgi:RecA/RadA recombinase